MIRRRRIDYCQATHATISLDQCLCLRSTPVLLCHRFICCFFRFFTATAYKHTTATRPLLTKVHVCAPPTWNTQVKPWMDVESQASSAQPIHAHWQKQDILNFQDCFVFLQLIRRREDLSETTGGGVSVSAPFTTVIARACIGQPCHGDYQAIEVCSPPLSIHLAHYSHQCLRPGPAVRE